MLFSNVADLRVEDTNKREKVTKELPPPRDMWLHLRLSHEKVVICLCTIQEKNLLLFGLINHFHQWFGQYMPIKVQQVYLEQQVLH